MQDRQPIIQKHPLANDPKAGLKLQAISALLAFPTLAEAAGAVGIHRTTLSRWFKQPAFRQALAHARRDPLNHSGANLQRANICASGLSLDTVYDPLAPPTSRVGAAGRTPTRLPGVRPTESGTPHSQA